jgi:hypothetical protein
VCQEIYEYAWVNDAGKCICESTLMPKELSSNCLNGVSGYKNLSPSCKLWVLNILGDGTLRTK